MRKVNNFSFFDKCNIKWLPSSINPSILNSVSSFMLFSLGFHPQALFLKHNLWTSNSKNTSLSYLFNNSIFLKLLKWPKKKVLCIYVRKYRFPLKVEKFDSFYKPWCMPDQIKGTNDYNSNQPTKGLEKVVCQDNLVDKILKLK